jgi:hypothetical protein
LKGFRIQNAQSTGRKHVNTDGKLYLLAREIVVVRLVCASLPGGHD